MTKMFSKLLFSLFLSYNAAGYIAQLFCKPLILMILFQLFLSVVSLIHMNHSMRFNEAEGTFALAKHGVFDAVDAIEVRVGRHVGRFFELILWRDAFR